MKLTIKTTDGKVDDSDFQKIESRFANFFQTHGSDIEIISSSDNAREYHVSVPPGKEKLFLRFQRVLEVENSAIPILTKIKHFFIDLFSLQYAEQIQNSKDQ